MEGGDLNLSSIEERVVRMLFDNKQFEQGVSTTLASLDKLNKGLKLDGAAKGLDDVSAAASKFSLGGIANGIDGIASKFKTLSLVGISALNTIVSKAVDAGLKVAKALTFDPVMAGFKNYETQINATQTILANTAASGVKIGDVNKVLAELNTYANQTVYNFSEMTKNIGAFTAAGVDLKTSAAAIKGIANLAALSGSNSDQAAQAMNQLSQAIAAGKVGLEDWNSVVNAGLGGKTFQTALINTARASGVAIDSIIKKEGSFRLSLQDGWLTSDILTKTLSQFTGDLTEKQIRAMGYTAAQAKQILATGKLAVDSATKIKTMSQLTDALKEEVATSWAAIFKTIFGGIGEATTLFSGIHNVAENALTKPIYSLNTLLEGVVKLGGRKKVIDAFANGFKALGSVIAPIGKAFRDVFPPATAAGIEKILSDVDNFSKKLILSSKTADELKRTFAGVFAVLGIGWDIVKAVVSTIASLFSQATKGSSGFFKITASVGDFLVSLHAALEAGDGLTKFFQRLGNIVAIPIKLLQVLAAHVSGLFDHFNGDAAAKGVENFGKKLSPLGRLLDAVSQGGDKLSAALDHILTDLQPMAKKLISFFGDFGKFIAQGLSGANFGAALSTINTGLFAGLVLLIKKFVDKFHGSDSGLSGIVGTIKESFEELTNTLKTMQTVLKATILLQIAVAIGILTISVVALSNINTGNLKKALTALAVMFTQLFASMAVFNKLAGGTGFGKMILVGAALILIATAIDVLVIAVTQMAKLDWKQLAKGLTGVTVLLAALAGTLRLMPPASGMISTGLGLIALAGAINLLVMAVTSLSGLSWQELGKGLAGVAGLLISLALFTKFADAGKAGVLQGAGIVLLAVAIQILAGALQKFAQFSWTEIGKGLSVMAGGLGLMAAALFIIPPSSILSAAAILIVASSLGLIGDAVKNMAKMSWKEIGKGLTVLAGALLLISAALFLLPPTSLLSAAAILVVASSLGLIADALKNMASMSWEEIGKGLVLLAGSLTIITAAMILMTEALPGAAALLVVAASLLILTPVLQAYGNMSWEEIAKGLTMLAGVFIIIGLAGLVLAPLVPVLIALGLAITLMGVGVLAAGAGVFLFATALTALAVAGTAGVAAIIAIVTGLIGVLPTVAKGLGQAIVAFAQAIATSGPAILKAIVTVLDAFISAIATETPKAVNMLLKLVLALVNLLIKYTPQLVTAGIRLVTGILNGIASNEGKMIAAATNVIVNFLNGIAKNLPRIVHAGANLIIAFVNSVADEIRRDGPAMGRAGGNLAEAIVEGMATGLASGAVTIAKKAAGLGESAISAARGALHINSPSKDFIKIGQSVNEGFLKGLESGDKAKVDAAFNSLKTQIKTAMADSAKSADSLSAKLKKLENARHRNVSEINSTAKALAQAKKENKEETAAYNEVTKALNNQHTALGKLATQYTALGTKITAAKQALTDAQKTLADYNTSVSQQYGTATAAGADSTVADYTTSLQKQLEQTKEYANVLQRLHALGLDDATFKQLTDAGLTDLPFAEQLLAGGKSAISQINSLDKQLAAAGSAFGKEASTDLYQAAVNAAAGLVKGLENQQAAIQKQMDKIADAMVKAIKKKLGIKSPSKVLAEVGEFSGQGLANGLAVSSSLVEKSASDVSDSAVETIRKSLSNLADLVVGGIDITPTITPVLDLSGVKKDASQIGGLLSAVPLSVSNAFAKATSVSNSRMSTSETDPKAGTTPPPTPLTFIQNNTSPKALSSTDIYRQTKNQLSKAKGALPKP
jgi:tape measure domain-containing protein